jgi:hypothetical protein
MKDKDTNTTLMNNIYIAILSIIFANILVWFQLNGQFKWEWFKNNELLIATIFSLPISWLYIQYQKNAFIVLNESLWSIRLIGFSIGLIIFSIMTWVFSKEVLEMKHLICIVLAFLIIGSQTFVK